MILAVKREWWGRGIFLDKSLYPKGLFVGELLEAKFDDSGEEHTTVQKLRGWLRTTRSLEFPSLVLSPSAGGGLLSYLAVGKERDLDESPENKELAHNSWLGETTIQVS